MAVNNNNKIYFLKNFGNTYGINSKKVKKSCFLLGLNPFNKDIKFKKKK